MFLTAPCHFALIYGNIQQYMRSYDVVLVFRPAVTTAQRDKFLDSIKKWLGEATVANLIDWGKKSLAYPIKKEKEGNYVILEVEAENGIKSDFEKRILMEDMVIRHLVIRKD